MNNQVGHMIVAPDRAEAKAALARLRAWAQCATPEEVADLDPVISRLLPSGEVQNYPALARAYPDCPIRTAQGCQSSSVAQTGALVSKACKRSY